FGIGLPILQYQQIPEALLPWMRETGMLHFLHHQRVSDGSLAMHGYAASTVPQIRYSRVLGGSTPVALWLSPRARENYRDRHSEVWKELRRNALALRDRSVTSGPWTGIPELPVIDERAFLTRFADPGAW